MSRVLESDDLGTLSIPSDLLGHPAPHTRFVIESNGRALHIERETKQQAPVRLTHQEWKKQWDELAEQIGKEWKGDRSAAETVSEMRR